MFERTQFAEEGEEAGVFISGLGSALITWTAMQDHVPTVAEAATAFNTRHAIILEAVEAVMWINAIGPDDDHTKQRLVLEGA